MNDLRKLCLILVSTGLAASGVRAQGAPPLLEQFDSYWKTFDSEYSYFELKKIDWNALRDEYRPKAAAAKAQWELIEILKAMTAPLRDVHVALTSPAGTRHPTYMPQTQTNWNRQIWQTIVDDRGFVQFKPNLSYCMIDSVAYVTIGSWNGAQFTEADLDSVVNRVSGSKAMIVDVRMNGGGNDGLAFAFASRLTTKAVVTGYVRFRKGSKHSDFGDETTRRLQPRGSSPYTKPVIVLSGRAVYSSNESFIAGMRELPNVTVMGDTTGGATANPATHDLGGGWKYSVSRWIEWLPDRQVIEWKGIPPDVYVAWDERAAAAGRDVILEAALARLGASLKR